MYEKILKVIGFSILIIVISFLIDTCIFGNAIPSNVENQVWAGF